MPRVVGIDPGTVSIDVCGLDEGRLFLDRSLPTAQAVADPASLVRLLDEAGPLDLVAGPSGYGLPLRRASELTAADLSLAFLAPEGESGGIGGLRRLVRMLAGCAAPVVLTPGVIHLPSVPAHRKVNRVDMGTADKVCATALAVREQAERFACPEQEVSLILLELGGAFSAAIGVENGRIVDGLGGSSGPLGASASGALDGEVAYLAGTISKAHVFRGGARSIARMPEAPFEELAARSTPDAARAWDAYLESAVKAVAALTVSVPGAREVVLSGRIAQLAAVREELTVRLARVTPAVVRPLAGIASSATHAAQGAALIAD
ncbi:MAG TPA: DUF1464 family protein, partial [Dehalococcoidia bacterium]|nr:DUF1464 family protein [Dehalococcoidia bacterium]